MQHLGCNIVNPVWSDFSVEKDGVNDVASEMGLLLYYIYRGCLFK
jgi:hypothetical protein